MWIRKDDLVEVTAGDDKGKRGKVLRVLRAEGKVLVEGINKVYKHLKPSRANPQGGRLSKEMPIDASNVALIDPSTGGKTRVGVRFAEDGTKELYAKKSGTRIRTLSKADPKYAKKK
jgi:large subunit ribosomal protein L24